MADNIREQRECQQNIEHIYSTRMSCDDILDYIVPKKKKWSNYWVIVLTQTE